MSPGKEGVVLSSEYSMAGRVGAVAEQSQSSTKRDQGHLVLALAISLKGSQFIRWRCEITGLPVVQFALSALWRFSYNILMPSASRPWQSKFYAHDQNSAGYKTYGIPVHTLVAIL